MGKRNAKIYEFSGFGGFARLATARKESAGLSDKPQGIQKRPHLYQLTLRQTLAAKFGRKIYFKASKGGKFNKKTLYDNWRMGQNQHKYGGSGYDEMTRTSLARDTMDKVHKARIKGLSLPNLAAKLSMNRANTDALAWYKIEGGRQQIGGHPGALRLKPKTKQNVVHGHASRDNARAAAAETEFKSIVPDVKRAEKEDIFQAVHHMNIRSEVETIRTMSLPYEHLMALRKKEKVYHARFGNIEEPENFDAVAKYVHNEREHQKWDTARKMMTAGLDKHVPEVMQEYIKNHGYDHTQAKIEFWNNVEAKTETRVNNATATQAQALDRSETLSGTAGRKRALSDARRKF